MITGRGLVCDDLARRGLDVLPYDRQATTLGQAGLAPFIDFDPDLLITDTISFIRAPEGLILREFWQMARQRRIPSLAYMDCWWGYEPRFKLPSEAAIPVLPDSIGVVDRYAAEDFVELGFAPEKMAVLGCPRFQKLSEAGAGNDSSAQALRKAALGLSPEDFQLIFVSQPLEKVFGGEEEYGFTEKSTLRALLTLLDNIQKKRRSAISITILLHPEERQEDLQEIVNSLGRGLTIRFLRAKDPIPLLLAADLVCGMFSIMLAEAAILQRPVLSVQLNLQREEILVTNRIGATLMVREQESLATELTKLINQPEYCRQLLHNQKKFQVVQDSIERWSDCLEKMLNS